jgi:biopolymer transport protein ExbD
MTPMVDLAFLLLTFFILTTSLAEQKTLDLVMPSDKPGPVKPVNNAITYILSKNDRVFYYENELKAETVLKETHIKAIRQQLKNKNKGMDERLAEYQRSIHGRNISDSVRRAQMDLLYENHKGVHVVIKYDSLATYRHTIDMVDEMENCSVLTGKYAIVKKLEPQEKKMLKEKYD